MFGVVARVVVSRKAGEGVCVKESVRGGWEMMVVTFSNFTFRLFNFFFFF